MRLRHLLVLASVAALAVPATAVTAPHAGPLDSGALLQQYAPVLYFHPQEEWAPETADGFLAEARIERQASAGKWTNVPPPLPTDTSGCALTPCYRLDLPCPLGGGVSCYLRERSTPQQWAAPSVYARVVTVPAGVTPAGYTGTHYLLRYWLFYRFDDWRSPHARLWQAHEGDWESISIGLSRALQPLFAAYSEHCSGTVRSWSAVATRDTTHPVDYVALGSHANYFTNAESSTKLVGCMRSFVSGAKLDTLQRLLSLTGDRIVDRTGTAHPSGPDGVAGVAPLQIVELGSTLPDWALFPGRWSEGQLLWLGKTPRSFTSVREGLGPATPSWSGTSIPSFWHEASS
jgi:hypothetical protein